MRITAKRIAARRRLAAAARKPIGRGNRAGRGRACKRRDCSTSQPVGIPAPSAEALIKLRTAVQRRVWPMRYGALNDGAERRISREFARELRARGWLHEEGYAKGSWAAQR